MRKINLFLSLGIAIIGIAIYAVLPAHAETSSDSEGLRDQTETRQEDRRQETGASQDARLAKLSENKKKVCEKRLTNIKRTMTKAHERATRQLDVFTKIADRTKVFYQEKQYALSNYDELVAAVDDKKQAAMTAVSISNETIDRFTCDTDDPIAIKDLFKAQIKDQNSALKAYKTAVKDLIVAVKSAHAHSESADNSANKTQEEQR